MGDADRAIGFVDVLTARTRGTKGIDPEIFGGNRNLFALVGHRQDGHGAGRCMDSALGFGLGYPLHPMATAFEFKAAINTVDLRGSILTAIDAHDHLAPATQV